MSVRELVVLGTASQVPTRHRNHNGYLLQWDQHGLLFDPGEGTQRQMTYAGVSASQISQIAITHFHGDHCLGFAGIVQRISLDEVKHEVQVTYPESGQEYIDRMRHASIFHDKSSLKLNPIKNEGEAWNNKNFSLRCKWLEHSVPTLGYRVEEADSRTMLPDKLQEYAISGRDIKLMMEQGYLDTEKGRVLLEDVSRFKKGQSFAFVMDTKYCQAAVELADGVDLLVCESTYLKSESVEAKERGHMTAQDAANVAQEAGAKKLVLTHFSQRYPNSNDFLLEASLIHENVVVAKDGDRIEVPKRIRNL